MKQLYVVVGILLLAGCSGPTKSGKLARVNAHQRMDTVNADLAAQQARQQFEVGQLDSAIETIEAAIARYEGNASYHLLRGRDSRRATSIRRSRESVKPFSRTRSNNCRATLFPRGVASKVV